MGTNKKGEQTKEYIFGIAKQLFYDIGYKKTTLSKISETAQVPIGLIPYHFTNKDNIVTLIYSEYMDTIRQRLSAYEHLAMDNAILYHGVLSRIYYHIILSDDHNKRFYHDVLMKKSHYKILNSLIREVYKDYISDFDIHIDKDDFDDVVLADFGARREFILHHLESGQPLDIQKMVTFANGIVPRLMKMDSALIDEILETSLELFYKVDFDDIRFLV